MGSAPSQKARPFPRPGQNTCSPPRAGPARNAGHPRGPGRTGQQCASPGPGPGTGTGTGPGPGPGPGPSCPGTHALSRRASSATARTWTSPSRVVCSRNRQARANTSVSTKARQKLNKTRSRALPGTPRQLPHAGRIRTNALLVEPALLLTASLIRGTLSLGGPPLGTTLLPLERPDGPRAPASRTPYAPSPERTDRARARQPERGLASSACSPPRTVAPCGESRRHSHAGPPPRLARRGRKSAIRRVASLEPRRP